MRTPLCSTISSGLGELGIAAALGREIDDDRAGPHALDHRLGQQLRRRASWDQRRGDDDVLALDVLGHELRLLLLVGVRHLLGVAAEVSACLNSSSSTAMNLAPSEATCSLTAGRTSVAVTMAPSRRAVAMAWRPATPTPMTNTRAAGTVPAARHHHRQSALERGSGIDHGLVAGEIRLRRQHVHDLRAGDARHQLHGEQSDAGLGQRIEAFGIGERIEHADQRGALLHRLDDGRGRAAAPSARCRRQRPHRHRS